MASSYTNKHRKIHSEHHKCLKMQYEVCKVDENVIVTVIFFSKRTDNELFKSHSILIYVNVFTFYDILEILINIFDIDKRF